MKKIIMGIFISVIIITSAFSAAVVIEYKQPDHVTTTDNNEDSIENDYNRDTELKNKNEISVDDISNNNLQSLQSNSTNTSINEISPYNVTYSPYTITATGPSDLDNVTLYYRWSDDNISWGDTIEESKDPIDSNTSDVDASADKGTETNFANAQDIYPDNDYMNIQEENMGGGAGSIAKIGTDTSGSGNALTLSFSHTLVAGSNRIVVVYIGIENGDTIDVSSVTYGGVGMTKAVDGITGTSGFRYLAEIWYILEANLPSIGSRTVSITCSGTLSSFEIAGYCAEYTGVNQGIPEATDNTDESASADDTIENTISPSSNAWVLSVAGCGNVGTGWTHGQGQTEVFDFADASSRFGVAELRGATGTESSLSSTFSSGANRMERVAASFTPASSTNYNLDFEYQWTNADFNKQNEEICIYVSSHTGSENLNVNYWTGSSWSSLGTITGTGWTNLTANGLTSSTYTIQLIGGTETNDNTQDDWNIDVISLHTWSSDIDPVDSNTSNVDSSPDKGIETNFANAQDTSPDSDYMNIQEENTGGAGGGSESIPEDFENGIENTSLWNHYSSNAYGVINYGYTTVAHGGTYSCGMYSNTNGQYVLNEIYTIYDFTGASNINIDFWEYDSADETNDPPTSWTGHGNYDAVAFTNDGTTWYTIFGETGQLDNAQTWEFFTYNISNHPNFNPNVNSNFAIKFQQYDNYQWPNDGRAWDDIYISFTTDDGTSNHEIDFEYQWTNADFDKENEEICIYVGSHTGSENLNVNYWTGSSWSYLGSITGIGWTNLTANGLTSSTYTIQLIGATESDDTSQDNWDIDVIMLHNWNSTTGNGINWIMWNNASNPDTSSPWSWEFDFPNSTGYYEFYSIGKKFGEEDENPPIGADAICYFNLSANNAPIANDDYYNINEDINLYVPAPGVLANDTDEENDSLIAIKVRDPSNGTLIAFNANGSFYYVPDVNFFGSDSFTYQAYDGIGNPYSNVATVWITINPQITIHIMLMKIQPLILQPPAS